MSSTSQLPVPMQLARAEAEGAVVRRRPGRPRKIRPIPTLDEVELAKVESAACKVFVANDPLVRSLESAAPSIEILRHVLQQLALESASIKYETTTALAAAKSDGISQRLSRRIDGLSKMAAITLEMGKLGLNPFDPYNEAVQRIFGLFLTTVEEVARETLVDADAFVESCGQALVGWEERVAGGS